MPAIKRVKQRLNYIDLGFLVVLVVCLLAIWPFLSRAALPQATDAELHIFRLAELSRLFRGGEFFPRWAPNFYYGFGYPIFNYYAPLTYYLGLIIDFMPVLGPVEAVKGLLILGLLGAGFGMYGYVRESWGRAAAVVSAASYVYAPYLLYIDPHARGDLAEAFSFAIFPLALWAMDRLRKKPTSLNWIASSLLIAAIIMTHNLMAMVFVGLLFGWAIWQELIRSVGPGDAIQTDQLNRVLRLRLFMALFAGIGLAAVFWLVVAMEQQDVNLSSLIGDGGHFDFRNHFLTLGELFSGSKFLDWGATEPNYVMNLGISQWLLGLLGIFSIVSGRSRAKKQGLFFVCSGLLLVLLMLAVSTPVWQIVPFLPFLQFPWRLLGAAAAMIAVLSGIGVGTLVDLLPTKIGIWLPAAAIALIMLLALPLIQVPPWPSDFGPTTARRVLAEELAGRWLGTTSTADFVPATVDTLPRPEKSLLDDIFRDRPVDRVNRATLPPETIVSFEEITPLHTVYEVSSDKDFLLRLFLFDFPGWVARIDGKIVETELARPEGFLVVPIPAGNHVVDVEFINTPVRTLAWAVTIASLGFVLIVAWLMRRGTDPGGVGDLNPKVQYTAADNIFLWPVLGIALIILIFNIVVVQPGNMLHYDFDGKEVQTASEDVFIDFGGQIALIGYDFPDKPVELGKEFPITAYWKLLSEPVTNYQVFLHIFDEAGDLVAQSDKLNPGEYPARRWPEDKYVRDEHAIIIPAESQPGVYTVSLGLWVANEGWRLPVRDQDGNVIGDSFTIGQSIVAE